MGKLNALTFEELLCIVASLNFTREHADNANADEVVADITNLLEKIKPVITDRISETK